MPTSRFYTDLLRAPLVAVAVAYSFGVFLEAIHPVPPLFAVLVGTGFLLAFLVVASSQPRLATCHLLLAVVCLGVARAGVCHLVAEDDISQLAGPRPAPIILRGTLTDEPHESPAVADPLRAQPAEASTTLTLNVLAAVTPYGDEPRSGRVRVFVSGAISGIHAGDEIEVSGRIEAVASMGNPGEFDRAAWAENRGLRGWVRVRPEAVRLLVSRWTLVGLLGRTRQAAHHQLDRTVPASTAPLARALLLGEGSPLRREDWARYMRTGVVHVLAISGQHLVILAAFLGWTLTRFGLRRVRSIVIVAAVLLAYALLTGGRPPALRAAILADAVCAGVLLGRGTNPVNLVSLAWLVVGVWHPPDLIDTGCQLSFWSSAVLVWGVGPLFDHEPTPLERVIAESRPPLVRSLYRALHGLRIAFLGGILAWLAISPLVAYHTLGFAPAALLLGPPLVLLTSIALVAGFLLLLLGWIPGIGFVLAPVVHHPLAACDTLVSLGDSWRLFVPLDPVPGWWIALLLLLLAAWTAFPIRPGWPSVAAVGWLVVLLVVWSLPRSSVGLRITFLDVGHGGCTLLELPCGRNLLYDAGSMRGPSAARTVGDVLAAHGVRRLDDVILSHADLDHFNALPALMERVAVGRVLMSATFANKATGGVQYLLNRLGTTAVAVLAEGDRLESGAVTMDLLHPPRGWERGNENARSLVLHVRHRGHSVLLTGDLEGEGLTRLLASPPRRVDVLMAPHHGSRRVDLPGLVRWCRPGLVVSCQGASEGRGPLLPVPRWETWKEGAVSVTSEERLTASAFRTGSKLVLVDGPGKRR